MILSARAAGLFFLLFVSLGSSGRQQQDSVLNRIVSVHADSTSIANVLRQITLQEEIYFSYDASLVNAERNVTVSREREPLINILNTLFPHGEFSFVEKEDYIIITSVEDQKSPPSGDQVEEGPRFAYIQGKVSDLVTREPLSYVSISIKGHPYGTITNQDGEYIFKIPEPYWQDSVIFSFVGYTSGTYSHPRLLENGSVQLRPVTIRIREVKVRAVSVEEILDGIRENITKNYAVSTRLYTGFYRETVKQDEDYISVSEAVMEVLKAPYHDEFREDRVRLIKARRSPDVKPFNWVNFKLQGGPYTITKLDAVKTHETFLDKEFQHLYRYTLSDVIWYQDHPVYVISFRPEKGISYPLFRGEMYVDRESYALLYARFSLDNYGLGKAEENLIKRKPRGFRVKPLKVEYIVDYQVFNQRTYLHSAKAIVAFRVRSREDRVNSVFESVSELLVTQVRNTDLKRFPGKDIFTIHDIFAEMTVDYDEHFWENYNIIKPDEDLQHALKRFLDPVESNTTND